MKISAFDIRIGNLIEHQGKLWRVAKKDHVKPGKGGAFVQLELKQNQSGTKLNERFLYKDGDDHIFMDLESYEQIHLISNALGDQEGYLLPNGLAQINFYNGEPIGIELPSTVTVLVAETEAVVKGQTAAGSGKPAVLETGLRVVVPTFIEQGNHIRINTETGEYLERVDKKSV